ncbi:hypothetical protein MSAN_00269900 [Mycena sanguinolenta]|uniref:Uncharacterized protein n=1 Tax=Mycena sanguinolenta TaxID=230812 RepID=A0A8H7DP89_9AGAR|nr:hypothetical protein MSAN_00269900 [Mycena sanguinolenta]
MCGRSANETPLPFHTSPLHIVGSPYAAAESRKRYMYPSGCRSALASCFLPVWPSCLSGFAGSCILAPSAVHLSSLSPLPPFLLTSAYRTDLHDIAQPRHRLRRTHLRFVALRTGAEARARSTCLSPPSCRGWVPTLADVFLAFNELNVLLGSSGAQPTSTTTTCSRIETPALHPTLPHSTTYRRRRRGRLHPPSAPSTFTLAFTVLAVSLLICFLSLYLAG